MDTVKIREIELAVDGDRKSIPLSELGGLYLLLRALEGYELAAEILDSCGKVFRDANGKQIWPPVV